MAALDPAYVQDIDIESTVQELQHFAYDPVPVPNPDPLPHMFCSCQEAHFGICKSDVRFAHVQTMVQQFQQCCERHKLQGCALLVLKFSMRAGTVESASSSSSRSQCPGPVWGLLGCVSKRPLCHVLGLLAPHRNVDKIVTPLVQNDAWQLQTLHDILRESAASLPGPLESLVVECTNCEYEAVSSRQAPNHFRVGKMISRFCIGPQQAMARTARAHEDKPTPMLESSSVLPAGQNQAR